MVKNLSLSRDKKFFTISIIMVVLILASLGLQSLGADDIHILFENYIQGKESALVKLHIHIPKVNSQYCAIAVYRFPSMFNPTKENKLTLIKIDKTFPGNSITVNSYIKNALPVSYKYNKKEGTYIVNYREPQQYLVQIKCYNVTDGHIAHLTHAFSKVYEVKLSKPITDYTININQTELIQINKHQKSIQFSNKPVVTPFRLDDGSSSSSNLCDFGDSDSCTSITKLAYINSIPGLEVRFKLQGGSPASAMYLSSYMKDCLDWDLFDCTCYQWDTDWYESGKVLTPSLVTQTTPNSVSNGEKGIVSGSVQYNRQILYRDTDGFAGVCDIGPAYFVYPKYIGGLQYITIVGHYSMPSNPSSNAFGPIGGNVEVYFGQYGTSNNDEKMGLSTAITFCATGWGPCATLNIDVYNAGRYDKQYITPIEVINDISGNGYNWYYWWFRNNNPMTYEIEFYGTS
jgi:hypothetical protein